MQNSNQVLENKFANLYFYAKSQVKRKNKIKIKCSTSLKRAGHVESKFDRLNFPAKSSVKSKKKCANVFNSNLKSLTQITKFTPLKSYKISDQGKF